MRSLFIVITILVNYTSYAQTDQLNLDKYWKFRNEFVEKFVKIGGFQGESLPAGKRKPCHCVDTDGPSWTWNGTCFGEMHWGDGMIRQGHYLGFLATEYALMTKYNQDSTETLHELYYAIAAINRVDLTAESSLDQIYGVNFNENLNGFYLREDIPEDFASEFTDGDWDMMCTNSAFYHNNNAGKINNPANGLEVKGLSYINVPSLDQMSSLLVGLSVVHKLVDNVYVKPTASDQGFYIKTEIEAIVERMVEYASDRNWQLIDVNGWPVANGGGDLAIAAYPIYKAAENITGNTYNQQINRRFLSVGKLQQCITGFGVDNNDPQDQIDACNDLGLLEQNALTTLNGGVPAGPLNNQDVSVYQSWQSAASVGGVQVTGVQFDYDLSSTLWEQDIPDSYPTVVDDWEYDYKFSLAPWPLSQIKFEKLQLTDYNTLIFFNLGVISGTWSQLQAHEFADFSDNRQLELVNALLQDQAPTESKAFYKTYLDGMPKTGSYFLRGTNGIAKDSLYASGGWATGYRWASYLTENIGIGVNSQLTGVFNGIDYMYFHNLYYLAFGDQFNLDPFEKKYDCYCDNVVQKPIPTGINVTINDVQATQDLNKKLEFVGSCVKSVFEPVNNAVYGAFSIEPFFSEYIDAGIKPSKYQTEDATIHSGADVQIQTDFVICSNNTLTTEGSSDVTLSRGHLIIKSNAKLDVSGTVRIKAGNKIDFEPTAKIILRSGSKLIIEDSGKFLLNHFGKLEFYDGAQVIMEGANSEFIMRGGVIMMDGGTFTLDHSASAESGKLIIDKNGGFLRAIGNTNPCFVELYGKDTNDEFIILKKDKGIIQYDSNTPQYINKLTIHHCKVRFEENSYITSYQPLIAYQTTFESDENNNGIRLGDQNNFSSCNFYDVPVQADLFVENADKFNASNCKFWSQSNVNEQGRPLVYVNGMGFDIYACEFKGSQEACLRSENLLHQSTIASSSFQLYDGLTAGTTVVGVHDVSNVEVKMLSNTIGQMNVGVSKVGGNLSLKCNDFSFNEVNDVIAAFGCRLNMSTDLNAGYNQFYTINDAHILLQSAMISLSNGRNKFNQYIPYYVKGSVLTPCGVNTDCAINANKNQWKSDLAFPGNPDQSKFDVVGSDNLPYQFSANMIQVKPPCGYYDNGDPSQGTGQSGYPVSGTNNFVLNVPTVSLSFSSSIGLNEAVEYADRLSNLGQSIQAIEIYDEIFDLNLPKENQTTTWMYRALSGMKSSLENAMFEENLLKDDNLIVFESHVQSYVDALNYMSDMSIENDNYKEQFYLEIEKSHLYRMLEIDQMSNEILSHIDVCGLDQDEQAMLNYWKAQYDIDLTVNQMGYAYIDSTVAVDTSTYNTPVSYTPPIFNFGSHINGVYNVSYTSCASGNAKMNALANRPLNELNVHPNPADKFIDVQFDFDEIKGDADILVTSLDGKEMLRMNHDFDLNGNELLLDVSNWEQGGYLITARTASLGTLRKQFVVTR